MALGTPRLGDRTPSLNRRLRLLVRSAPTEADGGQSQRDDERNRLHEVFLLHGDRHDIIATRGSRLL